MRKKVDSLIITLMGTLLLMACSKRESDFNSSLNW